MISALKKNVAFKGNRDFSGWYFILGNHCLSLIRESLIEEREVELGFETDF